LHYYFGSSLGMLSMFTTPDLTLLFLGVVVGLGTAFVWMLWEMEQTSKQQVSKPRRNSNRAS
jgi:predicted negative regulator of RcsB-dependent stress response